MYVKRRLGASLVFPEIPGITLALGQFMSLDYCRSLSREEETAQTTTPMWEAD